MTPSPDPAPNGIDRGTVEAWFLRHIEGIELPLTFGRISGGLSNLTYEVSDPAGRRLILRRPPLGTRLASAHDMGRERRVILALEPTPVPVPVVAGFCEDETVNGAPFYVMEFVDGPVLRTCSEAEEHFTESERHTIGERLVDTLVDLHDVDPDSVGLGELGRRENYVGRQLRRWIAQWEGSKTRELEAVDELHRRLEQHIPAQGSATIAHGDYRLDNLILSNAGEIAAVVDWELCTLGDPLADVGMLMAYWSEPGDETLPLGDAPTLARGFPDRREILRCYAAASGRDLAAIDFYIAFAYWKVGIFLEGIVRRFTDGQYATASADVDGLRDRVQDMMRIGGMYLEGGPQARG